MEPSLTENDKRAQKKPPIRGYNASKEFSRVIRIPLRQRLCYGVGHVVNDLSAYAAFSYVLVFWTKVMGIKHTSAGIIFLIAQVGDAVASPLIGYMCDRFKVPLFSRMGRRKGWHLLGTILLVLLNPFLFGRCFLCAAGDSVWYAVIYYSVIITCIQLGFASVQISHLSLLSEIARKPSQAVELNSIRATFTFVSGMFIYGVTWILLDDSSGGQISPDQWKEFLYLGLILVGVGAFTSLIFYIGVVEPSSEFGDRNIEDNSGEISSNRSHLSSATDVADTLNKNGTEVQSVRKISAPDTSSARDGELGIENTALETEGEATNGCSATASRGIRSDSCTDVSSRVDESTLSIRSEGPSEKSCNLRYEFSFSNELFEKEMCEVDPEVGPEVDQEVDPEVGPEVDPKVDPEVDHKLDESTTEGHSLGNMKCKTQRTQWHWLRTAAFYQISTMYMCTRLVTNVSNSYFPLFLIDALQFEKEAIAYFPLVALVSGVVFSTATQKINKILGSKISFLMAAATVIGACVWYYTLSLDNRSLVYGAAIMMGSGISVMTVTSLAMVNEFIGSRKESSAFVYGLMSFIDKLTTGVTIALIQEFYPQGCERGGCAAYVRFAFSVTCGVAASLGLVIVALFSNPRIVCRIQVETAAKETQTEAVSTATNNNNQGQQWLTSHSLESLDTRM